MIFHRDLATAHNVCPKCDFHMKLDPEERFSPSLITAFMSLSTCRTCPPTRLSSAMRKNTPNGSRMRANKTGQKDAVLTAVGTIDGLTSVVSIQNFKFMGGSLGMAAGEAHHHLCADRHRQNAPFILFTAAGGARIARRYYVAHAKCRAPRSRSKCCASRSALHRGFDRPNDRRGDRLLRHVG